MSHKSIWTSTSSSLPFLDETLSGSDSCDVAIVGAGITGLTAACLLQQKGKSVIVLDKQGVAKGDTSFTTAHLTTELDLRYFELASRHGEKTAKQIFESQAAALRQIESLVREENIECGFRKVPGYLFTEDGDHVEEISEECEMVRSFGGEASVSRTTGLPFLVRGAMKLENQAELRPLEYCRGLAAAFLEAGGKIYAHTNVLDIDDGDPCVIRAEGSAELTADNVLVCTHTPIFNRLFIHTKVASYRSYVVAMEVSHLDLAGIYWDCQDPYHYLRSAFIGGKSYLIVGGEDRKTGSRENTDERFEALEEYAGRRIPGAKLVSRWSGQIINSLDGLPFIGRNALDRKVFVATGFGGNGITQGTLSAILFRDAVLQEANPWSDLYAATRLLGIGEVPHYLAENKDFAVCFVHDRLAPSKELEELSPGEGSIAIVNGEKTAVFREQSGKFRAFNPTCPHMGCLVRFNQAEMSWDCPCHGSRFDLEGKVVNGPAHSGLTPVSTESWPEMEEDEVAAKTRGEAPRADSGQW